MSNRVGVALFLLTVALGLLLVTVWTSSSKLNLSQSQASSINLNSKLVNSSVSKERLGNMVSLIRNKQNESKFSFYEVVDANRVEYTSVRLQDGLGVYTINVFPDSVTYWYKQHNQPESRLTWSDHDMDGEVDFGVVGDIAGKNPKRFDVDFRVGLNHRGFYQALYNDHFEVIATKLGL